MDKILEKLLTLTNKYKENKYRLASADNKIACEKLQLLFLDARYVNVACKQLAALPETCCQAFLNAWQESDDSFREQLTGALLAEPAMVNRPGGSRMIKLIADFISVDQQTALILLLGFSKQITRGGTEFPPSWLAKSFWKGFIVTEKLPGISLADHAIQRHEITALAIMAFSGILENPGENSTLAYDLCKWIEHYPEKLCPAKELVSKIEKVTKKWPEDLQRQCQGLGLIKTVRYSIIENREEEQAYSETPFRSSAPPSPPGFKDIPARESFSRDAQEYGGDILSISQPTPADFSISSDAKIYLDWLSRHITNLEKECLSLTNELHLREVDCSLAKKKNAEQEILLANIREQQDQNNSILLEQANQIATLKRKKQDLEEALQLEINAKEKEVEKLKDRIERESSYVLKEFKNILMDRLFLHYKEYCEARTKPPSDRLASFLNHRLQKVFRELINLGVELDGEK